MMEELKKQFALLIDSLDARKQSLDALAHKASLRAMNQDDIGQLQHQKEEALNLRERKLKSIGKVAAERLARIKVLEVNQTELVTKERQAKAELTRAESKKKELESVCAELLADKKRLQDLLEDVPYESEVVSDKTPRGQTKHAAMIDEVQK